jgi:succinyl-CoA synthetase beta subunit
MCGKHFVYKGRTGKDGYMCDCVFIVERLDIAKEIFLCITYDVSKQCPVIYYSKHGGQSLEKQRN